MRAVYVEEKLALCQLEALNAWDKVAKSGKRLEPLLQVMQVPKETFPYFLQRLTSAVERSVSDPSARKTIIKSSAFENVSAECNEVRPPRTR